MNIVFFFFSTDGESDVAACATSSKTNTNQSSTTPGELGLDDLPPVPDMSTLSINVKEEECIQIGIISSIVDRLG